MLAIHTAAFALLRSQSVQSWIAHRVALWLSEKSGQKIEVSTFNLGYHFDVTLGGVSIPDNTGQPFVAFKSLKIVPSRFRPARNRIRLASVFLDSARVAIVKHPNDSVFNYNHFLSYLPFSGSPGSDTVASGRPLSLFCDHMALTGVHFTYLNHNKPRVPSGMDYHFIDVDSVAMVADQVSMVADSFNFVLTQLTGRERSGLKLNNLTGRFRLGPALLQGGDVRLTTPRSDLDCDFTFRYSQWSDYEEFIDKVWIEAFVRWSSLNLAELAPFSGSLEGMNNDLRFGGVVNGTVANLRSDQFTFTFGEESRFDGSVRLVGLPDVEETFIRLKINDFLTTVSDIREFNLGNRYGTVGNQFLMPAELLKLGFVGIRGNFTGFYNDFVADATFQSALGEVTTDLVLRGDEVYQLGYEGNLKLKGFDVGVLTGQPSLGPVTLNASLVGHGVDLKELFLNLDGKIARWRLNGYDYRDITVKGLFDQQRFSGILGIDDPNLHLSFNGAVDLNGQLPVFNFAAAIASMNPAKLGLFGSDTSLVVSTVVWSDFSASNPDNLTGTIRLDSLRLANAKAVYNLNTVDIQTDSLLNGERLITLRSDVADGLVKGKIKFSEIGASATLFIRNYLASFKMKEELIEEDLSGQHFSYQLHVRNPDALTALFFPSLKIAHDSRVEGYYDAAAVKFRLQAESPALGIGSSRLNHWFFTGQTQNNRLVVQTGCQKFIISQPTDSTEIAMDSLVFLANVINDSILYHLSWNDTARADRNRGAVTGFADFSDTGAVEIRIVDSKITISDVVWEVNRRNVVREDSAGWHFSQFGMQSGNQSLLFDGTVADDSAALLSVRFNSFDLSLFDPLLVGVGVNPDGHINGEALLSGVFSTPRVVASLTVNGFGFNGFNMGTLSVRSEWDNQHQSLLVDAGSMLASDHFSYRPLQLKGYYFPYASNQNFDLDIGIENFDLRAFNPLVDDNISQLSGFASAQLHLAGSHLKPDVNGSVKLQRTEFRVNYLNTRYSLADKIEINHDRIEFKDLVVNDSIGNKAYCNGLIRHNYLSDFDLDLTVRPESFILLNTEPAANKFFYGTAVASGLIRVNGPFDNISLHAQTRLLKGTEIFLPLSMSTSVAANDFIVFLNQPHDSVELDPVYKLDVGGFNLNFDLGLTPDARLEIALPYQSGTIECKGQGNINLTVNSKGDLGMDGDYNITNGNFLFKYRNLFSRNFEIRQGSNIRFNGSPYDAVISMAAVHHNRTTLSGLDLDLDSTITRARIPVNSVIRLKNKLLNPDISFSVEFPKLEESTRQVIYAKLDTANEVVMTQQIISLLVLNNFSFNTGNNSITNSLGISGFELLSNQVSSLLSQVSRDVDIGINYRPGDNISAQEFEVMLRTQLFDDRVSIDGNLGVTGNENTNRASNIVGDVNVEVKLTDDGRFKFKAFNRSNNLDLLYNNSPYTQGVGFSYRREFNRLGDLFRKRSTAPVVPEDSASSVAPTAKPADSAPK